MIRKRRSFNNTPVLVKNTMKRIILITLLMILFAILPATAADLQEIKPEDPVCPVCMDLFGIVTREGCMIKGNINSKGDHIYHCPRWRDYDKTEIDEEKGERWFCTEEEARAAGWRAPKYKTGSCRSLTLE